MRIRWTDAHPRYIRRTRTGTPGNRNAAFIPTDGDTLD